MDEASFSVFGERISRLSLASLSLIHLSPGAIAAEPRLIPESQGGAGDFPGVANTEPNRRPRESTLISRASEPS